jgi:hypothetical protein
MKSGEHKSVQARILAYAEAIGWTMVFREEAEERRGGIPAPLRGKVGDRNVPAPLSLFFDDLLDAKVREFNPLYQEAEGAGIGQWQATLFHLILQSGLRLDCAVNPQEEAQKATCATKGGFCGAISHFAPL